MENREIKKAVLIDVSAIMYRAYFSLMNLKNSKNEPTGAILGFTNNLLKILDTFKPDYIAACFDVKRDTLKRREEYTEYKEHRESMPEGLVAQVSGIEKIIDCFNIKKYRIDGYEADDVIGTLAKKLENENIEVYVVTGDKDLSQIISDKIRVALPGKTYDEAFRILKTSDDVIEQLGVVPSLIPDLFGLQGDASDGIPGVRGIGPKTAIKLILEYNNLENLYENIDKITGKIKDKLIEDKGMAFLSRSLATIRTDIPISEAKETLEIREPDKDGLFELFTKYEFRALIKKMGLKGESKSQQQIKEAVKRSPPTMSLLDAFNNPQPVIKETKNNESRVPEFIYGTTVDKEIKYKVAHTATEINLFKNSNSIALYYSKAGIALSNGELSIYFPIYHNYLGVVNIEKELIMDFFGEEKNIITYDVKEMWRRKIEAGSDNFDIMIAYYLLYSDENYSLEKVIFNKLGIELEEYKEVFGKIEEQEIEIEKMAEFSCKRAYYMALVKPILENELKQDGLYELFTTLESKLMRVLSVMEKKGIKINSKYFLSYSSELSEKLKKLEEEIYEEAGFTFNINSPKQLSEVLFSKMGIIPDKKTKTGYSTDVEVLENLAKRGETIAKKLLDFRQYTKLKNTYVDVLPKLIDENGRIHTTFHQNGTATGRLSSSEPNLQNIPVKTDEGIKIRKGFIAEQGYSLVAFDYSQIELRVLAEITEDEELVRAYKEGIDLHALTASKIFDKAIDNISREERIVAKIVNFSIIYGKTAFGLSKEIDITPSAAKEYIDKYFIQYKGVKDFIDSTIQEAEMKGFVKTLFGRRRKIEGIDSRNKNIKHGAERMAVNSIVQGTAADILKIVMIRLYDIIKEFESIEMLLQIHDELVFEIKDEYIEKYVKVIKEIMENTINFKNVKLEVNYKVGKNWDETK